MVRTILLKEEEKAMEYIEEKEKFINIVNNHRISFNWDRAKGVNGGTRNGYYYKIILDTRHFKYWEGSAHEPINENNINCKIVSFLHCLVLDYFAAKNYDLEDFAMEFGYDLYDKETKNLYNTLTKQAEKLEKIFSEEELEQLQECFQNY